MTVVAGCLHHVLFFDSAAALAAAAVPFLRGGLDAGDAAVLVCRRDRNVMLAEALGGDSRLLVLDQAAVYTRSANAVAAYRRMMLRHTGSGRLRLVGEVDFDGGPTSWSEWTRFEAVVNAALAPYPLSSVCAYDTGAMPGPVLASAAHTHPLLLTGPESTPNPAYIPPAQLLHKLPAIGPDPLQDTDPTYAFGALTEPAQLADLRRHLRDGVLAGLPTATRTDLVTAIAEVVTNGLVHGRPPVRVELWAAPTRILCTVTDRGAGFDDPLSGYVPHDTGDPHRAGVGLWLARQSCDHLDTAVTPKGFTVRLSSAVPVCAARSPVAAAARAEAARRRAHKARARAEHLLHRLEALDARHNGQARARRSHAPDPRLHVEVSRPDQASAAAPLDPDHAD
ncbi:anti-sigma factor RsbA family regulatory protein [Krasilnikovia sp. MM14-A1004]|uniref:anti-sigma factor RsbA family regulatory protein n=1 Tax=Krasilnikovia sp. MM14-A1004 TaxID=3373541 RepID=UPI00399D4822